MITTVVPVAVPLPMLQTMISALRLAHALAGEDAAEQYHARITATAAGNTAKAEDAQRRMDRFTVRQDEIRAAIMTLTAADPTTGHAAAPHNWVTPGRI